MEAIKKETNTASLLRDEETLDRVFQALSDRTRRAILTALIDGPAMVTELAAPFEMSLPAVSKHLKVLERAGLLSRQIDGRVHRCSLNAAPLNDAGSWLEQHRCVCVGFRDR